MELDFSRLSWPTLIATLLAVLVVLAVFGAMVTPAQAGEPELISPDRWTAARLARQAQAEAQALMHNASQLHDLLEADQPEPVAAMLLAQRIYAVHREGTSATGSARLALISAAEFSARYAVGELPRQTAVTALNNALERIGPLLQQQTDKTVNIQQDSYLIYVPLVQTVKQRSNLTPRSAHRTRFILPNTPETHQ